MSDIVIEAPVCAATVEAELNYLEFTGEKPVSYQYEPPPGARSSAGRQGPGVCCSIAEYAISKA